mgnify:CR=1 FL=1
MRKPRDFDAELKSLEDKTRDLKARKVRQLGELVISTGADVTVAVCVLGRLLGARRAARVDVGARRYGSRRSVQQVRSLTTDLAGARE